MTLFSYITYIAEPECVRPLLISIGKESSLDASDSSQCIELKKDSATYLDLVKGFKDLGIQYDELISKSFTQEELSSTDYLRLVSYEALWFYPEIDESYILDAYDSNSPCSLCKQGARQIKPFSLTKLRIPKKKRWLTLDDKMEHIIRNDIASKLQSGHFTGMELWPINNRKDDIPIENWQQIYITNELPSLSSKAKNPEVPDSSVIQCSCKKSGYYFPETLIYNKKEFNCFKDFNKTHEWFGAGVSTDQSLIISTKVYKFLVEEKLNIGDWEPVVFVD